MSLLALRFVQASLYPYSRDLSSFSSERLFYVEGSLAEQSNYSPSRRFGRNLQPKPAGG